MRLFWALTLSWALILSVLAGCGAAPLPNISAEARCRVGQSQTSVLVTEWGASEKANLEAALNHGAVAVAFSGCELRLVPSCALGGAYQWHRTTPSAESIALRTEADIFTKVPLGFGRLSAELAQQGELEIQTTVAGQIRLTGIDGAAVPSAASCAAVTHVVSAVSVGAFQLRAGRRLSSRGAATASLGTLGGAVGAAQSQEGYSLRSAGDARTCAQSTADAPEMNCASPLQLFLSPVPGRATPPPPPGTVAVDIVSGGADTRWDVIIDDQARCTTPCGVNLNPAHPLLLRTRDDHPDQLYLPHIPSGEGPVQIVAQPKRAGQMATGITFTALSGMGLIAGVALTGVGCSSDERAGLCTAGQITMFSTAPLLAGAIWLLLDARADLVLRPLFGVSQEHGSLGLQGQF